MKILKIIESMSMEEGGPPEVARNLKNFFYGSNIKIHIFSYTKMNSLLFFYLLFSRKKKLKFFKFLKKFDIIHFHQLWSLKSMLIIYFAKKLSVKYIFISHGYLDGWSLNEKKYKKLIFIKFFLQKAITGAYGFFFSTIDEYNDAMQNITFNNFFVIPNGIDLQVYHKKKYQDKTRKKISFFGRVHKKKGIEILLDAIKLLPDHFFEKFYFEITGPGKPAYVDEIKNKIIDLDISNKVSLKKPILRDKKINYLNTADVFILPSFEEGDSIALKEAMAIGMPVLISKQCRLNIVEEASAGYVMETNKESILENLLKLLNSDLETMGNNARQLIVDKFDNIDCAKRLEKIYVDIYTCSKNSKDWINED